MTQKNEPYQLSLSEMPGHTHRINPPDFFRTKIYNANIILSIESNGTINILKSRHGITGARPLGTVIDLMSQMIASAVFKGNLEMFQEGLKIKLVKKISKILIEEGGDSIEDSVLATSK